MLKEKLKSWWQFLNNDARAQKGIRILRRLLVFTIIGIIVYQLFEIGWVEVLRSLPVHPLFYLLFFVLYLTLPVAEIFIYKQVWNFKSWEGFKAFITKKVYNEEVMGYSGEFYLFIWGRNQVGKQEKDVLKNVRDNNIISAVSSNTVAVLLVGILIYAGQVEVLDLIDDLNVVYVITGIIIAVVIGVLAVQFRRYLFDLPPKKALVVLSIYMIRFVIHHGLLIVQWAVVIPNTPISVWFTFLAIVVVVNRIPFIPSKDLVFVWFGIELSRMLGMATAAVAGMLLVTSALTKVTNLILFSLISYYASPEELNQLKKDEKGHKSKNEEELTDAESVIRD